MRVVLPRNMACDSASVSRSSFSVSSTAISFKCDGCSLHLSVPPAPTPVVARFLPQLQPSKIHSSLSTKRSHSSVELRTRRRHTVNN